MPRKKKDEEISAEPVETVETEETAIEAASEESAAVETAPSENEGGAEEPDTEKKPKKASAAKAADDQTKSSESIDIENDADASPSILESIAASIGKGAAKITSAVGASSVVEKQEVKHGKRAEKIGIVSSDKMMKTVTVRVDRLVKHPVYRKYVRKRKKFMAHDDMGAKIGDKVKIVETRPLSARKRWRVVEIIQKAEL